MGPGFMGPGVRAPSKAAAVSLNTREPHIRGVGRVFRGMG